MLERLIVDARDAIEAIEHDEVDLALARFASIRDRLDETAQQITQSAGAPGS